MTREAKWKKQRYRNDPAFRAARLEEMRVYYATRKDHPVFKELVLARSYVYHKREALHRREAEVSRMYNELDALIEKRDRLAKEWKSAKPKRKGSNVSPQ